MAGARQFTVLQGDVATPVGVLADGRVQVGEPGDVFTVIAVAAGEYVVSDGARSWSVAVAGPPDARWVGAGGASACVEVQAPRPWPGPRARDGRRAGFPRRCRAP